MEDRATLRSGGSVSELLDVLGDWQGGARPLFRNLARAIAGAIERGVLAGDVRLPSERALAAALAIGRGTAVAAYEVLVADGLVERRIGSGTYVAVIDQPALPRGREGSALVHRLVERSDAAADLIDLSLSVLWDAGGLQPVAVGSADLLRVLPGTGYTPWGLASLRRAVAAHITGWGLPTDEHQVVITTGAQQAISAAAACWIRPGDTVLVDDPTYPGALAAFVQSGATVVGVAMDEHGVRVRALEELLATRPALVYLQSTVHSPTGIILDAGRRQRIAALVAASNIPLVEDLALADLAWKDAPPPIAAGLPHGSVAVVGSLSKLFWGGLRVGFLRAPEPLALRFARIKATHDLGSSAVSQLFAERLLRSEPAVDIAHRRSTELQERCDALITSLGRHLPTWTCNRPSGGLSLWVRIPATSSEAFAQHAARYDVGVATPRTLSPSDDHADRLRLSFAGPPEELDEGVCRLAAAWAGFRRTVL